MPSQDLMNSIGSLFAGPAGYFGTPQNQNTNTTGSSTTNSSSTTNPLLGADAQDFLNRMMRLYTNYLYQTPDLRGYQAQQVNQINDNAQQVSKYSDFDLARRGLSTSPVAGAISANNNMNRVGQINTLNQSIPLLQRQLQGESLQAGNQFFNSIPKGQTSTGTQNTNSTQRAVQTGQSGGGAGGFLAGLGSTATKLGPLLAAFSDERMKKNKKLLDKDESLNIIRKLKPSSFKWKENNEDGHGFMAQDVAKVLPKSVVKDDNGFHRMDMMSIIPHLVNAVQALDKVKGATK